MQFRRFALSICVMLLLPAARELRAATLESKDGARISGEVIFDSASYVWIEPKGTYPRLIARENIAAMKDYDGKPARTDGLPGLFVPLRAPEKPKSAVAALERWYTTRIEFGNDPTVAASVASIEPLLDAYMAAGENDAKGLLDAILAQKLPPKMLREVLLHGHHSPLSAPAAGTYYAEAPVPGFPGKTVILAVSIPEGYGEAKTWPLLINLHGTSTDHAPRNGTEDEAGRKGYIVVAPMAHAAHGWGPSRYGQAQVLAVAQWAQNVLRIDPDRVFLQGMSMGGVGAKRVASVYPDRFAAICSRSGPPIKKNIALMYRNLSNLPLLSFQGADDRMIPVDASRWEKSTAEAEKLPATMYVLDGRGHETYIDHDDERLAFFEKHTRTAAPERLRFASYGDDAELTHYYVEITPDNRGNDSYDYNILRLDKVVGAVKAPTPEELQRIGGQSENLVETRKMWINPRELELHVDRKTNTVVIDKAARVAAVKILVSEDRFDLDREITVQYQGRVLETRKVVRSSAWMLDYARRTGRRDVAYWGWMEVRLAR